MNEDQKQIVAVKLNSGIYHGYVVEAGSGFFGKGEKGVRVKRLRLLDHPSLSHVTVRLSQIVKEFS